MKLQTRNLHGRYQNINKLRVQRSHLMTRWKQCKPNITPQTYIPHLPDECVAIAKTSTRNQLLVCVRCGGSCRAFAPSIYLHFRIHFWCQKQPPNEIPIKWENETDVLYILPFSLFNQCALSHFISTFCISKLSSKYLNVE